MKQTRIRMLRCSLLLRMLLGLCPGNAFTSHWRPTSDKVGSPSPSLASTFASSDDSGVLDDSTRTKKKIFVLNWDGCVADTVPWRIESGINAAIHVWPELPLVEEIRKNNDDGWLRNKLSALSHVFVTSEDTNSSLSCEYALAARLLLEEQMLDGGESNGKSGKYARKFHPQKQQLQQQEEDDRTNQKGQTTKAKKVSNRNSRPLTVGEVGANWAEGGMIRDTIRVRYHCNYKDPLPILQQALEDNHDVISERRPVIDPSVVDALTLLLSIEECSVLVTVNHGSELSMAEATLRDATLNVQIAKDTPEALQNCNSNDADSSTLSLVVTDGGGKKNVKRDIVEHAPMGSTIYIVESSWDALQRDIKLYGDYIPRQGNVGKCVIPDRQLSLNLAGWMKTIDPTQHSAAIMNPWTNVLSLTEFRDIACPPGFQ